MGLGRDRVDGAATRSGGDDRVSVPGKDGWHTLGNQNPSGVWSTRHIRPLDR